MRRTPTVEFDVTNLEILLALSFKTPLEAARVNKGGLTTGEAADWACNESA
jgi:hypothetical protein